MERNMNTATFKALRDVGFDEKQATVLATAIPDIERPLADLRTELKGEMRLGFEQVNTRLAEVDTKFAEVNAQFARQRSHFLYGTLSIVGTLLTIAATAVLLLQRAGLL